MEFKIWSRFSDEYWQDLKWNFPETDAIEKEKISLLWQITALINKRSYYELDKNFEKYFFENLRKINNKKTVGSIQKLIKIISNPNYNLEDIIAISNYQTIIKTLNEILDNYINFLN